MTARDSVIDLLKRQKNLGHGERATKAAVQKSEWLNALENLMKLFSRWLNQAQTEKLLEVEVTSENLREEKLGSYAAPAMKIITPTGTTIGITPKGRFVVGGMGRVDFEYPPRKAILIRKDSKRWQFAELSPGAGGWTFKDLTEESFWDTLRGLLA